MGYPAADILRMITDGKVSLLPRGAEFAVGVKGRLRAEGSGDEVAGVVTLNFISNIDLRICGSFKDINETYKHVDLIWFRYD